MSEMYRGCVMQGWQIGCSSDKNGARNATASAALFDVVGRYGQGVLVCNKAVEFLSKVRGKSA